MNNKEYENEIYAVSNFSKRLFKLVLKFSIGILFTLYLIYFYIVIDKLKEQHKIFTVIIYKLL